MSQQQSGNVLQIKKYPNRRYYDATRSRHITLQEVYELIQKGHDVVVTDSRNGDDITNIVLMQILLEKEHPKLDVFPSSILHMMVRTNHQALRSTVDAFFGPFLSWMSSSQRQFDTYWRQLMSGQMVNPMEWTALFRNAFATKNNGPGEVAEAAPEPEMADQTANQPPEHDATGEAQSLDDLRRQVSELTERLENISPPQQPDH